MLHQYLSEYLIKSKGYSSEKSKQLAKQMMIKHKDNLFNQNGLAYWLGGKSLLFFCRFYLRTLYFEGNDIAPLSKTHYEIWQELEDMILLKNYNNRNYLLSRGFGKTTCISTPVAIWSAVYGYKEFIVIASAILDTATQFLKTIKAQLEDNPYIESSFGKLIDRKTCTVNEEKLELTTGVLIQSISASGAIRGKQNARKNKRIELLILDDFQKTDEVATEQAREKKWQIFNADAKNALQKNNATMLAVGTIQHKECFYSRLANSPTWKTRHEKGVLIDNCDEYFHSGYWETFYQLLINSKDENRLDTATEYYLQNKEAMQFPLLWQEYWNCLDYALNFYEDKYLFLQEVQNDVSNLGQKKFTTILTEPAAVIETHNFSKTLLQIDPAGTRNKGGKQDYYAYALISVADNGIKYIRKGEIYKQEYEDYIKHTLYLLREYKGITNIAIEKNTYSGADVLKLQELISKDDELKNRTFTWDNFHQNANKDDKINTVVGAINLGQVIFNEEDTEAIQQLKDYCGVKFSLHDDFPDVLAEAINRIENINVVQYATFIDRRKLGI